MSGWPMTISALAPGVSLRAFLEAQHTVVAWVGHVEVRRHRPVLSMASAASGQLPGM